MLFALVAFESCEAEEDFGNFRTRASVTWA